MKKLNLILEKSRFDKFNTNLNPISNKLKNHYNSYDEYHEGAIKDYTEDSESLNSYHWGRHNNDIPKITSMENQSQDMDGAINQHKTPHKLTVYSGIKYDPRENMDSNKTVNHPAYLSTSLDKHTARFFGHVTSNSETGETQEHVLKINVPKDHPGAYVEHRTSNEGEKEFILPRNSQLKYKNTTIHKKEDTGHSRDIIEHNMDIM